jgi:FAD-dependent urate hydroxylase
MEDLNVIIIGAGMAGLTTGIALRQAGYQIAIYDRVKELKPAGAAISLWSNGVKVLNRLGLAKPLAAIGGDMRAVGYFDAFSGDPLTEFSLDPLIQAVGQPPYPVSRTDLQNLLLDAVGRENVHLDSKLISLEDDGEKITAHLEDGRKITADLLVGADGTHSIVRSHVLRRSVDRRYAGYVNWNGLVPISHDLGPANQWSTHVGDAKRVSLMPVAGNRFYFFFDVPLEKDTPTDPAKIREELAAHFQNWAPPVQKLIERLNPATTTRVEIHDVAPLETLSRGRVALVGDSGHSTAPDLGQGGCMAMESALILANFLKTTNLGIEDSLRRYSDHRLDRVAGIITGARKRSNITHGLEPEKTAGWYTELRHETGANIQNAIIKTILGGPLH